MNKKIKDEIKAEITKEISKDSKKDKRLFYQRLYQIYMCFGTIFFAFLAFFLSHITKLEQFDQQISDFIYQVLNYRTQAPVISIIAIDDKTIEALGDYETWSRTQTAEIINMLNSSDSAPQVISIALDYCNTGDSAGDEALIETCQKYDNICFSSYIITDNSPAMTKTPHNFQQKEPNNLFSPVQETEAAPVIGISQPFNDLLPYISTGIVNNLQTSYDSYTRTAVTSITHDNIVYDSFALATYKMYMAALNQEAKMPKVDANNSFTFTYIRKSKDYPIYSFYDVVSGNVDLSVFQNDIVLIGDYTSAGSTFKAPNQHSMKMREIEVQANILEALLCQKTGKAISYSLIFLFYVWFAIVFFVITSYSSGPRTILAGVLLILFQIAICAVLYLFGYYILILIPIILIATITIFNLAIKYIVTKHNNYQLEYAFKKYVDKSIVDEIVETGNIPIHVGGNKKDIAVLFVDIRGFTSLSENMAPEQIVDILNQYLTLAANAVSKNNGTLDKFIGDAAMAVFNSPLDLEDYEYKAVCAAWDLLSSAQQLNDFCQKQYGKQVSFGIGIHCGEAVTGNIGCESRMDYTAIGDTVNTASRLESIAAPGQILISSEMKYRLGNRIQTSYAGEFSLKGKKNKVPVYIVTGIQEAALPTTSLNPAPIFNEQPTAKLYCIPSLAQISDYESFSKEYHAAFEYNDFFIPGILDNKEKQKQIMKQYMSLDRDRSQDTLHGAFLDICINSSDPQILSVSDLRVHQCMDIATEMGLKAVIFHTNYIVNFRLQSYLNDWLNRNEAYWRKILQEYPNLCIYLENMFDDTPELLTALAERLKDEPRFAVCLDTAHAFISGSSLSNWLHNTAPYVAHLHVNDNNQYEDLHQPIGSGSFPWNTFHNWVSSLAHKPSILIEVRSFNDLQKSVAYMKEHGIYPFTKE